MVNLKATVRVKTKNGLYPVYIRFTKGNQVSYVKTSWVVNEKGLDTKKNIIDPFVFHQTSILMDSYYKQLNQIDTSKWTTSEIVKYLTDFNNDISFSDYARKHIDPQIRNYAPNMIQKRKESASLVKRGHSASNVTIKTYKCPLPHHAT